RDVGLVLDRGCRGGCTVLRFRQATRECDAGSEHRESNTPVPKRHADLPGEAQRQWPGDHTTGRRAELAGADPLQPAAPLSVAGRVTCRPEALRPRLATGLPNWDGT